MSDSHAPYGSAKAGIASSESTKSGGTDVFWCTVSAAATGGAWALNDSTDGSGTDLLSLSSPANSIVHMIFDPPIHFGTGLYVAVTGSNLLINLGYN